MNNLLLKVIIAVLVTIVCTLFGFQIISTLTSRGATFELSQELKQARLEAAKSLVAKETQVAAAQLETQLTREFLTQNMLLYAHQVKRYAYPAVIGSVLLTILIVGIAFSKRLTTHNIELEEHVRIPVRSHDLKNSAAHITAYLAVKEAALNADNRRELFEMYLQSMNVNAHVINALNKRQNMTTNFALPESQQPALQGTAPVPTFQQLLISGDIAPGKPMILGYEQGTPRKGSFLDIYSAAIAGESGSGKTATLLFLIGSGLVSEKINFMGIDPHYPHPKSLGYKTKPLWESGLMTMATNKDDSLRVLKEIEKTIDQRLQQIDTDTTPVVLVIDELAFLAKTSLGKPLAHTMERISTEGRKCAVYLLASSQTWLVARTGESSVVRDTLTSAYVHRIKPKQANLLLQDKDEADKVKKYVKQAGDVLLCPVNDESIICKMPYTTDADMHTLLSMFGSSLQPDIDKMFQQMSRGTEPAHIQEEKQLSIRQIERETGIPYSALQRYYSENKALKPEYQKKLDDYLFRLNQVESALKSIESKKESDLNQMNQSHVIQ